MNFLVLLEEQKILNTNNEYFINNPEEISHIKNLCQRDENSILKVIVLGKGKTTARIKECNNDFAKIEVDNKGFLKGGRKYVSLALGGLRPVMAKRVIEHSTTLGVKEIHFFPSDLSVKSYFESKVFKNKKYLKYMIRGIAQGGNYDCLPNLIIHENIHEIEFEKYSKVCFLHKGKEGKYFSRDIAESENLLLLVGPERGWSKDEINTFENMKFEEIIISEAILRVEFAVNASLSQLENIRNSY
ncbi:MAG: RsmE family RNA methyltransferase [Candidatus Thalassarchaeaceae archaeon]|jgi:RsmE family RNA methyltransferase|nr:RsmE family RNA methyltransferase [Candidatus Thalassarchaeaceae archaeon]